MTFADAFDPIRALQSAWKLVGRSPAPLIAGGVFLTLFGDLPAATLRFDAKHGADILPALLGLGLCCGIVGLLLSSWVSIGLANATEKTLTAGSARFEDLFESKGRFFDMVIARLLLWVIGVATMLPLIAVIVLAALGGSALDLHGALIALAIVTSILLWLPVFLYVNLGTSLATKAVAIDGLKPTEALRRSWDLARGHRLRLFVYWIALLVFTLLGLCLCCIGVLFTGAVTQVAANESYLALKGPAEPSAPPPMPAA
jgi:lysylphosphatidylglycerol synthetase-like protein (DUF2156 family)